MLVYSTLVVQQSRSLHMYAFNSLSSVSIAFTRLRAVPGCCCLAVGRRTWATVEQLARAFLGVFPFLERIPNSPIASIQIEPNSFSAPHATLWQKLVPSSQRSYPWSGRLYCRTRSGSFVLSRRQGNRWRSTVLREATFNDRCFNSS